MLYVHIYHIYLEGVKDLDLNCNRKEDCRSYKDVLLGVDKLFHTY